MGIVFMFPTTPQTDGPDMNYSVVVLGGVLILSLVWYYFPVYGGVHWFTGPISNIEKEKDADGQSVSEASDDGKKNDNTVEQDVNLVQ